MDDKSKNLYNTYSNLKTYWPVKYTNKTIFLSITVVLGISLYFSDYFMPLVFLCGGLLIIFGFYTGLYLFPKKWADLSPKNFYQKLFLYSFLFRIFGLLYSILITSLFEPNNILYELNAMDSWTYHGAGVALHDLFLNWKWLPFLEHYFKDKSDWGFGIYTGIIYLIFGTHVIAHRIVNCLWGSLTVLLLSKIADKLFSFDHARLTGIIAMLFPPLIWFTATGLKETFMIFMFTTIFYFAIDFVETKKIKFWGIVLMVMFSFFLFFFRTFLGAITVLITLAYLGINLTRRRGPKIIIVTTFTLFTLGSGYLIYKAQFFNSILSTYEQRETRREGDWNKAKKDLKLNIKMAVVAPLAFAGAIITPLPSFLLLEKRQIPIIAHYQNEMIRNFLYYFVFIGLFYVFRKYLARAFIIIVFPLTYIFILATAGVGFQDRFVLPSIPFLIILMTVGIINSSTQWKKRWNIYLFIIILAQIAWNIFKLNSRGLI